MIQVQGLTKHFGKFVAVDDISFEAGKGEIFALIGPNGSGKSTTMKCIAGLISPTRGKILVDGVPAATRNRDWLSYLPQKVSFPDNLTGKEVLDFYRRLRKLDSGFATRALDISNLNGFSNRAVRQYSAGMLQRLGIAIALMPECPVVVLDEPTAGLDPDAVLHFRELLTAMRGRGKTVIVSSHALAEVEALADRVAILVHGRLAACEPVCHFRERLTQHALMRITLCEPRADLCTLACRSGALSAEIIGTELVVTGAPVSRLQILRALEAAGAHIEHFSTEEPSLERLYIRYTRENTRPHSGSATADRVSI
ncbi:MAG: ABC transporter ATP-binding protein [Candidatus Sulfotelmatobacter sp.]